MAEREAVRVGRTAVVADSSLGADQLSGADGVFGVAGVGLDLVGAALGATVGPYDAMGAVPARLEPARSMKPDVGCLQGPVTGPV